MKALAGFLLISLVFLTGSAWAKPFLVCDDDPAAEYYLVSFNGDAEMNTPAPLHYDLGPLGIVDGAHQFDVRAANVWGQSEISPFGFTKALPQSVQGLGLSSE